MCYFSTDGFTEIYVYTCSYLRVTVPLGMGQCFFCPKHVCLIGKKHIFRVRARKYLEYSTRVDTYRVYTYSN
jgi:hypothetical protein